MPVVSDSPNCGEPPGTRTPNLVIKSNSLFGRAFELESRGFRPPSAKNHSLLLTGFHSSTGLLAQLMFPAIVRARKPRGLASAGAPGVDAHQPSRPLRTTLDAIHLLSTWRTKLLG